VSVGVAEHGGDMTYRSTLFDANWIAPGAGNHIFHVGVDLDIEVRFGPPLRELAVELQRHGVLRRAVVMVVEGRVGKLRKCEQKNPTSRVLT
jgi:hypothetical protein